MIFLLWDGSYAFSPRQSDCMIVAGTVTYKMAEVVSYLDRWHPKWVVCWGLCVNWWYVPVVCCYAGVDNVVPVDVYANGCPPRPEALLDAMMKLQEKRE